MSFKIVKYREDNPMMHMDFGNREIIFSLASVQPDAHEWLGTVLERQIAELVELRVRQAVQSQQSQLRALLGLQ